MIDNNKILMLTQGQGNKFNGQGQIRKFVETNALTTYHEQTIGY